ncbi:hypothetical protein SPRG_03604 [Saprolegnia parasitica CBS 223.65]|uniref:Uncharacterized protein n=1 Tax=Saprolegnia parasitica (strain CBS 223.65) TaxID=695850 RepID=A0A067CYX3_SAPPC|nr:hypothetical protein SPRG_03604 [Saprolegnia parasitica CBS 223.65]KDO31686.1 hypothetical protein SPRG_03604 [Saprolegnia parasitica CBS 223.65]|eukprot:XP_012197572.1 hypothetical protein SPRG_03604 [Saprolegnia parasitica CBS 223.65]
MTSPDAEAIPSVLRDVYLFPLLASFQDGVDLRVRAAFASWRLVQRRVLDLWCPTFGWLAPSEGAAAPLRIKQNAHCSIVHCDPTGKVEAVRSAVYDMLWQPSYVLYAAIASGDIDLVQRLGRCRPALFSQRAIDVAEHYAQRDIAALVARHVKIMDP